jgi:transposase
MIGCGACARRAALRLARQEARPKAIAGEHSVWLLQRIRDRDFTLRGLVVELAERGLKEVTLYAELIATGRSSM